MDCQGRINVIIAVPDCLALAALAERVRELGYRAQAVRGARDLARAIDSGRPDIVLVDVVAPSKAGERMIRSIRAESPRWLPVLALTALGDVESQRRARDAGADDVVTVPISGISLELSLRLAVRLATLGQERDDAVARLAERDPVDPRTGLVSRVGFEEHLQREYARWRRHGHPLALLVADVDELGLINRAGGYEAGDAALQSIAEVLGRSVREADVLARIGDDELAILAPDTAAEDATNLAHRLRERVSAGCSDVDAGGATVSIGIAAVPAVETTTAVELVRAAFRAVGVAKQRGRNRCETA